MSIERKTRTSTRIARKQQIYSSNDYKSRSIILSDTDDSDNYDAADEIKIINLRKTPKNAKGMPPSPSIFKTPTRSKNKSKRKIYSDSDSDESKCTNGSSSSVSSEKRCSPPKQRKQQGMVNSNDLFSPSRLINGLNIAADSDNDDDDDDEDDVKSKADENNQNITQIIEPKKRNKYQSAKISLACTETSSLPGRENEIKQLYDFMWSHLNNSKSGSLYVSGQPGTGKTACLSNILKDKDLSNKFTKLYINCTSVSSASGIYKKICAELKLNGKTEKDCLNAIERFITGNRKMVLMVLDEIDQLVGQKQSVLYTIFEWPAKLNAKIIIVGIANSLDLTDRLLTRLNSKCDLKPKLLHFSPYTKQQIIDIFKSRLENAGVTEIFPPATIQLLAAKVAAISGDVRRALDIGRRVIEIAEQQKNEKFPELGIDGIMPLENDDETKEEDILIEPVQIKQVVDVLSNVYGVSQKLNDDFEDTFPLQQKILICTLMLMLKKGRNKDITIGRLHDVYKRVCQKRNILAVDQAEFVGICSLVETRGIIKVLRKKEPRLSKIFLQWDEEEVSDALKDKQLIATILDDISCLCGK